jgi:lysophospholipid acyltransferase (LPLAT)-like uncharacterized protein
MRATKQARRDFSLASTFRQEKTNDMDKFAAGLVAAWHQVCLASLSFRKDESSGYLRSAWNSEFPFVI